MWADLIPKCLMRHKGLRGYPFTSSDLGSTFQRWPLTRLISQWDRLRSKAGLETEARQKQAVRSGSYLPTSGTRSPQHPLPLCDHCDGPVSLACGLDGAHLATTPAVPSASSLIATNLALSWYSFQEWVELAVLLLQSPHLPPPCHCLMKELVQEGEPLEPGA